MSLLTDDEIDALGLTSATKTDVRDIERALLAKLASAELPPLPAYECGPHTGHSAVRTDEGIEAYGRQAYAQGAARQLSAEPRLYAYSVNKVHNEYSEFMPPHDAYDEGTLTPLFTLKEPK